MLCKFWFCPLLFSPKDRCLYIHIYIYLFEWLEKHPEGTLWLSFPSAYGRVNASRIDIDYSKLPCLWSVEIGLDSWYIIVVTVIVVVLVVVIAVIVVSNFSNISTTIIYSVRYSKMKYENYSCLNFRNLSCNYVLTSSVDIYIIINYFLILILWLKKFNNLNF